MRFGYNKNEVLLNGFCVKDLIQSVWDDTKTYSSRMIPPSSGLVWGWFGSHSSANLGVKLAILPPPIPLDPDFDGFESKNSSKKIYFCSTDFLAWSTKESFLAGS